VEHRVENGKLVVSGVGCLCALGATYPECVANLYGGLQKVGLPTRFSYDKAAPYPVFEVDDAKVDWPEHLRDRGRSAQLAVVAATEALADAGLVAADLSGRRVGVCLGTTVGNSLNNEEFYRTYRRGEQPDLFEMDRYFLSNPAELIAREFHLFGGPVLTVANACSSGTDAIGMAMSWLRAGLCDIVLAGGSDELSHISYLGFGSLMISSEEVCSPFDKNRKGLNLGEGAAILVIEKGGERVAGKCSVSGYGCGCDAYHLTAPHPDGLGLRRALAEAMHVCGIEKTDIGFINSHGTGTEENDRVEMRVCSEIMPGIPYFSIKGCTGHTLGAAGAIEAAVTVACLLKGKLPASVGFKELPAGVDNPPVTVATTPFTGDYGLSQSLAFGGNNSVVIFRR